jgi:poly-beta-1,6-N-acetyl-D-glucosamine synthase
MIALHVAFWLAIVVVLYTYMFYFILLRWWSRNKDYNLMTPEDFIHIASELQDPAYLADGDRLKSITLIVPAYNEERVIRDKLENCQWLSYKKDKLEVIVASDGSSDGTAKIVSTYAAADPTIRLIAYPERRGKTAVLNDTIPQARGEIVVLSDASSLLSIDCLQLLARHFYDDSIGCVSGTYKLIDIDADTHSASEGAYWRYETAIKASQGKLYALLGAHGALYAFLKKAFRPLPEKAINDDFLIPARIMQMGYKAVYETEAVGLELAQTDRSSEFKRRIRIMAGNFQQVALLKGLLRWRYKRIAFHFISHKVLRLAAPFLLLLLLLLNILLACQGAAYRWLLLGQIAFYAAAGLGYLGERLHVRVKPLYIAFYFNLINITTFFGFYRYVRGKQSVKWERVDQYKN